MLSFESKLDWLSASRPVVQPEEPHAPLIYCLSLSAAVAQSSANLETVSARCFADYALRPRGCRSAFDVSQLLTHSVSSLLLALARFAAPTSCSLVMRGAGQVPGAVGSPFDRPSACLSFLFFKWPRQYFLTFHDPCAGLSQAPLSYRQQGVKGPSALLSPLASRRSPTIYF